MSEMLAALLGSGGNAVTQAIAALSGGKLGAKAAHLSPGGDDPFMAVLFDRLNGGQAADAGGLPVEAAADVRPDSQAAAPGEQAPLKPLEIAMLQAQGLPQEGAAQVLMGMSLGLGTVQPQTPEGPGDADAVAGAGSTDSLVGLFAGQESKKRVVPASTAEALAGQKTVVQQSDTAETAASGQLLPDAGGREAKGEGAGLARANGTQSALASILAAPVPGAQGLVSGGDGGGLVQGAQVAQVTPGGVAQAMPTPVEAGARQSVSTVHLAVEAPVRSPVFAQELGERVVWLSSRQGQVADIALNPPHLGPLEVKISLTGGEAGAQFYSPHQQVRDAIESALPKLREMMADAGISLGQTQVREESFSRQNAMAENGGGGKGQDGQDGQDVALFQDGAATGRPGGRSGLGLVDLYV